MRFLRKATASQSRSIGPFVDDTDFKTAETALTIANTDIKLMSNGGASANKNSGGGTHRANGFYGVTFDATDTATVGELTVSVVATGALPVFATFFVLEAAVYDALFAASALGYVANAPVNVAQFGGSNGTFASGRPEVNTTHAAGTAWGSGAITAAAIADGAIDRATFAADTGLATARSGTAQAGAAGTITLDASASATTDFYKGSVIVTTGGTGAGQHRLCTAYNGSTKVATITPNWATNPDNTTTFAVMAYGAANIASIAGAAVSTTTAQLGVNAVQAGAVAWGSGAITAASIASAAITSAKIATDAITSTGFAQSAADKVWATTSRTVSAATNITSTGGTTVPQTGDNYARLGAPAGASVSADLAAVKTDTGNLVTRITSTLFAGITSLAQWLGLIAGKQTGDSTARTEIRATGAGSGTFDETTDSVEALRDRGDAAWTTGSAAPSASTVASAVRTELATELARVDVAVSTRNAAAPLDAAGTRTAVGLASANLDTQLAAVATASALSTVGSNVSSVKTKTDQLTFTKTNELDANIQSVNGVTVNGDGTTGNEWGP